jgi:hypothetical protein
VPHDFRLLLNAIALQLPSRLQAIIIAAERVPFQWQEYAGLMLPYMHEFVDEQPLQR